VTVLVEERQRCSVGSDQRIERLALRFVRSVYRSNCLADGIHRFIERVAARTKRACRLVMAIEDASQVDAFVRSHDGLL